MSRVQGQLVMKLGFVFLPNITGQHAIVGAVRLGAVRITAKGKLACRISAVL